ncbi:MAG: N-acetylmuramic acid 6-phosphate etherase [Longimicrobiaceae bacterium]
MNPDPPSDPRLTEQKNPASADIDRLLPLQIVDVINQEDRKVAKAVHAERRSIARAVKLAEETFRSGGRLIYVGAGTSGRLGVLDAAEMPPTYGTDPELVQGVIAGGYDALVRAREGAEDRPEDGAAAVDEKAVGPKDFVFGIATSGSTPFVHGALDRARDLGAKTGFLLCTPPSRELLERHQVVIAPLVGPEVVTGSTRMKAGTATKLVLNTITTGAMIRLGKVYGNLMVDLQVTCRKLQDRGERILMETLGLERAAARTLLAAADGSVKTAIAMHRTGAGVEEARELLQERGGRLGGSRTRDRA